ncbi:MULTISPECIES: hypothetical protein [unclassified Simplicispira]|uniref:hypothetical protein n=1 Tax=unclassified Simplicispira TaxID=2630407 RepID=UPI001402EA33|nr:MULTISPECIES: hypothetical protein [unclassified Simplicispira]
MPLRAVAAFALAVVLALVASAALLLPEATVQSVDSMAGSVDGLGLVLKMAVSD